MVKMVEKRKVIDELKLSYEGLFDAKELYWMIDYWVIEKGYDKKELKNVERITPTGKYVEVWIMPWRKITDYAKYEIKMRMRMFNVTDVVVERGGVKLKLNKGKIDFIFDGYLITDYEGRWEQKPLFYFLRAVFDKYIFKMHTMAFEDGLVDDINHLHMTIKSFLNLYRYTGEKAYSAPAPHESEMH